MIYHELGSSGLKISALSFGSMRWMNERDCCEIVNRGMDLGMNYVDTSTGYVGGKSDIWTANAIRGRREEMFFSSKSHWAGVPSAKEVLKTIRKTLKKIDLDYLDMYQIWGLSSPEDVRNAVKKGGFIEGVRQAQRDGLVRQGLGFTFHGSPQGFKAAVDTGEFISATISYNLMKRGQEDLIDYAAARGVGVIIMNPLAGGVLAMAGDRRLDFLRREHTGPCYGALRFLLANRNITTSLVGFSSAGQVDENARALEDPGQLTEEYRRTLADRMDSVEFTRGNFCTGCSYCKDCPNEFNPTEFMEFMRDFAMYAMNEEKLNHWLATRYSRSGRTLEEVLAKCTECGLCEEKCPQKLPIVEEIRRAKATLGN